MWCWWVGCSLCLSLSHSLTHIYIYIYIDISCITDVSHCNEWCKLYKYVFIENHGLTTERKSNTKRLNLNPFCFFQGLHPCTSTATNFMELLGTAQTVALQNVQVSLQLSASDSMVSLDSHVCLKMANSLIDCYLYAYIKVWKPRLMPPHIVAWNLQFPKYPFLIEVIYIANLIIQLCLRKWVSRLSCLHWK